MSVLFLEIGKKIKNERNRLKLTQEDLAEKIDMDARSVVAIESGHRNPTIRTVYKICRALRIGSNKILPF